MPKQIVMDHTGDSTHNFDVANSTELAAAEARFKELTGLGFTAATRAAPGESPTVVRSFDPTVPETLFFPRLQGG